MIIFSLREGQQLMNLLSKLKHKAEYTFSRDKSLYILNNSQFFTLDDVVQSLENKGYNEEDKISYFNSVYYGDASLTQFMSKLYGGDIHRICNGLMISRMAHPYNENQNPDKWEKQVLDVLNEISGSQEDVDKLVVNNADGFSDKTVLSAAHGTANLAKNRCLDIIYGELENMFSKRELISIFGEEISEKSKQKKYDKKTIVAIDEKKAKERTGNFDGVNIELSFLNKWHLSKNILDPIMHETFHDVTEIGYISETSAEIGHYWREGVADYFAQKWNKKYGITEDSENPYDKEVNMIEQFVKVVGEKVVMEALLLDNLEKIASYYDVLGPNTLFEVIRNPDSAESVTRQCIETYKNKDERISDKAQLSEKAKQIVNPENPNNNLAWDDFHFEELEKLLDNSNNTSAQDSHGNDLEELLANSENSNNKSAEDALLNDLKQLSEAQIISLTEGNIEAANTRRVYEEDRDIVNKNLRLLKINCPHDSDIKTLAKLGYLCLFQQEGKDYDMYLLNGKKTGCYQKDAKVLLYDRQKECFEACKIAKKYDRNLLAESCKVGFIVEIERGSDKRIDEPDLKRNENGVLSLRINGKKRAINPINMDNIIDFDLNRSKPKNSKSNIAGIKGKRGYTPEESQDPRSIA